MWVVLFFPSKKGRLHNLGISNILSILLLFILKSRFFDKIPKTYFFIGHLAPILCNNINPFNPPNIKNHVNKSNISFFSPSSYIKLLITFFHFFLKIYLHIYLSTSLSVYLSSIYITSKCVILYLYHFSNMYVSSLR